MTYQPRPLDLDDIALPEALRPLVERLAENNHDVWALQRLAEGWRYGPARNDATREHPCLVPYADLPESEKEYDRQSAVATIKASLALGFRLAPPPGAAGRSRSTWRRPWRNGNGSRSGIRKVIWPTTAPWATRF